MVDAETRGLRFKSIQILHRQLRTVEKAKMKKKTPRIGHIFLKRYLGHTKADLSGHSAADLVWRLHQLGDGVVHVADSVENALPLKSIGPLEHQVKVWNEVGSQLCLGLPLPSIKSLFEYVHF